jgi:hypothetical protein
LWVLHNKFKQSIIKAGRKLPFSNNCLDELINRFGLERVTLYHQEMFLLPSHAAMVREELPLWERLYLPKSLLGKTVLDVGTSFSIGMNAYFLFTQIISPFDQMASHHKNGEGSGML